MNENIHAIFEDTLELHPQLRGCRDQIEEAFTVLKGGYRRGAKVLTCGNGGSAADSEHIVGELMKGYRSLRAVPETDIAGL